MISDFLHHPSPTKDCGNIVTGGTEANILAMFVAREIARKKRKKCSKLLLTKAAHYSLVKAARLLDLSIEYVNLDESYRTDLSDLEKKVDETVVAVISVAGSTELGVIDPIKEIGEICQENDIFLHVDAAYGGFLIPFLYPKLKFDFLVESVRSITLDPHKMLMSPIPAGGIFFRSSDEYASIKFRKPYLTGKWQKTLVGTRSGAPIVATWYILNRIGKQGLKHIAKNCHKNAKKLADYIESSKVYELIVEPQLSIVSFTTPDDDIFIKKMREKGWGISGISNPPGVRVVIMPHVTSEVIESLIYDLEDVSKIFIN